MLKFKCDRCGKEMQREEAWAIVLAPGAYAAEGEKKRTQGEICGDCVIDGTGKPGGCKCLEIEPNTTCQCFEEEKDDDSIPEQKIQRYIR